MAVNLYGMMMDGLKLAEQGRADNQKSRLGVLASQVYTAPREQRTGLVGQMAALDPEMAAKTQTSVSGIDEAMRKQLADGAGAVVMAPPEMRAEVYRQMVPLGRQLGLPVSPEWNDSLLPHMQRLAGIKDETPAFIQESEYLLRNEAARNLDMARKQAGWKPELTNVPTGDGGAVQKIWNPRTQAFDEPNYGGASGGSAVLESGINGVAPRTVDPVRDFSSLTASLGIKPNSLYRDPQHNKDVGGVGNSYHLKGQAMDITPRSPEEKAKVRQWAAQNNYDFVDEGDHTHLEPRRGVRAVSGFGPGQGAIGPRLGVTPPKPSMTEAQRLSAENASERLGIAKRNADRADKIAASKGPVGSPIKIAQINNVDRGVARIDSAIKALDGRVVDTGPIDQYLVGATPAGKELKAAVGQIQESLLALTRVPGVGAQSDLEATIAALKFPSIDMPPEVNRRTLANLKAFVADLKSALKGPQSQGGTPNPANGASAAHDPLGIL